MENKFKIGQEVCAVTSPLVKLVVSNYSQHIYYCSSPYNPTRKDLALYEREILPFTKNTAGKIYENY